MKRILLLTAFLPSIRAFTVGNTRIGGIRRSTLPISRSTNTRLQAVEEASICVIGGGVSGLAAALTAAEKSSPEIKVVLLEASPTCGGRVQSDGTDDGYILDRGFAVFIEEYPYAKQLLDYDSLNLGLFLPGALVKLKDSNVLARVSDPLSSPCSHRLGRRNLCQC
jgi:hypothetical protein